MLSPPLFLLTCLHRAEGTAALGASQLASFALLQSPRILTWPHTAVSSSVFPTSDVFDTLVADGHDSSVSLQHLADTRVLGEHTLVRTLALTSSASAMETWGDVNEYKNKQTKSKIHGLPGTFQLFD